MSELGLSRRVAIPVVRPAIVAVVAKPLSTKQLAFLRTAAGSISAHSDGRSGVYYKATLPPRFSLLPRRCIRDGGVIIRR